jgi:hypothetical protein
MRRITGLGARWMAGLVLLGALVEAPPAAADGGIPRAYDIVVGADPSHLVVRSDFWGLFQSKDGGQSWVYACSELFGGNSKQGSRAPVVIGPKSGRLLVAASFDGVRMTDDLCTWRSAPGFSSNLVQDIVVRDGDVLALGSSPGSASGDIASTIYRSSDEGDSWSPLGTPLPKGFVGASLLAPGGAQRVQVVGTQIANGTTALATSPDDGKTWSLSGLTRAPAGAALRVHGQGAIVFVTVDVPSDPGGPAAPDEVWGSGDSGSTWMKVYTGKGDLPGLAIVGSDVLVSGADAADGIEVAALHDAVTLGQPAFQRVYSGKTWGLTVTPAGLYAGTDNFTGQDGAGNPLPAFTLGLSVDEGRTFAPLMSVCQVAFASCGAKSDMEASCRDIWSTPGGFVQDYLESPRCGALDAADGGGTVGSTAAGTRGAPSGGGPAGLPASGGAAPAESDGGALRSSRDALHISSGCTLAPRSSGGGTSFIGLLVALGAWGARRTPQKSPAARRRVHRELERRDEGGSGNGRISRGPRGGGA